MTLVQLGDLLALGTMPIVLTGIIGRVKSLWSGRRGPPLLQLAYDLRRLLQKRAVYSTTTTPVFRVAPPLFLGTAVVSGLVAPLLGSQAVVSFPFDFVWFAYVWAFGRVAIMLAALDAGSSFEGMGAAREALFSSLLEPAIFLVAGALGFAGGHRSLHEMLALRLTGGGSVVVWVMSVASLLVVVQVEASRVPVDDPATHLELTMVHEVMVLDHSGPDLAAIQLGVALKLFIGVSMIATLLNPWSGSPGVLSSVANLALSVLVAAFLATVESLVARLKMRAVPQYIALAVIFGCVALLASIWRVGGAG